MYDRGWEKQVQATGLAASGSYTGEVYFPRAVRVMGYYAGSSVAQAAHATATLAVTFTNRGTDGLGNTLLATITNNSGQANSATRRSAAYVAKVPLKMEPPARPDGTGTMYDAIAAGSWMDIAIATGAGAATSDVIAGLYGFYSG